MPKFTYNPKDGSSGLFKLFYACLVICFTYVIWRYYKNYCVGLTLIVAEKMQELVGCDIQITVIPGPSFSYYLNVCQIVLTHTQRTQTWLENPVWAWQISNMNTSREQKGNKFISSFILFCWTCKNLKLFYNVTSMQWHCVNVVLLLIIFKTKDFFCNRKKVQLHFQGVKFLNTPP